ncbi:folate-sensitive fragile site protein Fra10Ac1 [Pelagophyceae sp. CCMP2097]|nr:folate-sensitive fragile site protein Fra10Ac1 [Pelagophyceae sp. CCMP2097]
MGERVSSSTDAIFEAHHQFVRDEDADLDSAAKSWETRMVARHYRKLHKEYALVDTSRWRSGAFGLRWRTSREVLDGKGEKNCGALRCDEAADRAFELPFSYTEDGQQRSELVKVRVCRRCASKLQPPEKEKKKKREKTED